MNKGHTKSYKVILFDNSISVQTLLLCAFIIHKTLHYYNKSLLLLKNFIIIKSFIIKNFIIIKNLIVIKNFIIIKISRCPCLPGSTT